MSDSKSRNENMCDNCKILTSECLCEKYESIPDEKITVIGDSWLRLQVLPEVTSEKRKRKYQTAWHAAGASRVFDMISAAVNREASHSMNHLYIPKCPKYQVLATGLLKECEPDKYFLDNLRYIDFPEKDIPKNIYRVDRHWGAKRISDLSPKYNEPHVSGPRRPDEDKYWVIVDDCLYCRDSSNQYSEDYAESRKDLYRRLYRNLSERMENDDLIKWILWAPLRFGNDALDGNNKVCEDELILKKDENGENTKTNIKIKQRTIVFLSVDNLNEAGIGQRGDSSIEECLQGLLDAIESDKHNKYLKRFAGCAAIIIVNGVDSAFLIKLNEKGEVTYCQSFFRIIRTCEAYRQGIEFVRVGLMVASCLNALIQNENKDDYYIMPHLANGIKDGLWRMLAHFHLGVPVLEEKNKPEPLSYFQNIYSIPSLNKDIEGKLKEIIETETMVSLETEKGTSATVKKAKDDLEEHKNKLKDFFSEACNVEKSIEFFKKVRVHDVLLIDKQEPSKHVDNNYSEKTLSATNMSHVLRFPNRKFTVLPPWLLERQWDEIKNVDPKQNDSRHEFTSFGTQNEFLDAIVRYGLTTLSNQWKIKFPIARFGSMAVVDPEEISMFRRLQNLMRQYIDSGSQTPLGLAVFGPPGMGKSFAINQVAKTINEDIKLFVCNLSQFTTVDELCKKLLEARNVSNEGQYPIIFLDEFDSPLGATSFGWFKYLLALLQDGEFLYQGTLYHIAKAFVVCAGGLNRSFSEFEWKSHNPEFQNTKIPDLISRLRGHVNIKGPNPYFPYLSVAELSEKNSNKPFEMPTLEDYATFLTKAKVDQETRIEKLVSHDPLFKIRRAVVLRNVMMKKMPFIHNEKNELAVCPKVCRALLDIPVYKYGTRSIEAIIEMSVSVYRGSRRFISAMIPSAEQLEMHVDAEKFYRIMEDVVDD